MYWIKPAFPYDWYSIKGCMRNIKLLWYWCQSFFVRGAQGWCDDDVMEMDDYLIRIVTQMLKRLRDTTHGYPMSMTVEIWDEKLNKMIVGFEAGDKILDVDYVDEKTGKLDQKKYDELFIIFNEGMKEFQEHFFDLWD